MSRVVSMKTVLESAIDTVSDVARVWPSFCFEGKDGRPATRHWEFFLLVLLACIF